MICSDSLSKCLVDEKIRSTKPSGNGAGKGLQSSCSNSDLQTPVKIGRQLNKYTSGQLIYAVSLNPADGTSGAHVGYPTLYVHIKTTIKHCMCISRQHPKEKLHCNLNS
jgi:hypothetical protein